MNNSTDSRPSRLGTAPVFATAISTILGAILFLRFGYAVGHLGFFGTLAVILLGHLVTVPTAMAIAEIATNQRVQGGGEYFIISRSFGIVVGAAAGLALYLSRAISVSFYVIAFGEAFVPAQGFLHETFGITLSDMRVVTLPTMGILTLLMVTRGANVGIKALYCVVGLLFASLLSFLFGSPLTERALDFSTLASTIDRPDPFFLVFSICFPAFTGMAAGVGLSGDLRDPQRSIPLGTLAATFCGMLIYVLIALKLALSASPEDLVADQLVMSRISVWGPLIPIGLASATLSSALGSILVAPRILQALANDDILPTPGVNRWLGRVGSGNHEPVNASLVTCIIATAFVFIGSVDFLAQIISMFFMVTYGSLCTISFLEHFAGDPAYRPVFRSRWYISLFGAVLSVWLMFEISAPYATLAVGSMVATYLWISYTNPERKGLATIVQNVIFQLSRRLQVFLQQSRRANDTWRPAAVCLSSSSFQRSAAFDLLRWIAHRYGFGTYIHFIEGYLSRATHVDAREKLQRLVRMVDLTEGNIFVDTLVSPSFTTAISQLVQLPGISGKENNLILLEFSRDQPDGLVRIIDNYPLIAATEFDICILGSNERGYGYCSEIHIWTTPNDYENLGLMIMLAYVILGHPDWRLGEIKIFAIFPAAEVAEERGKLADLIRSGRLSISEKNVEVIAQESGIDRKVIINEKSADASLTILGFRGKALKRQREDLFEGFTSLGNVLFVNATKELEIVQEQEEGEEEPIEPGKMRDGAATTR